MGFAAQFAALARGPRVWGLLALLCLAIFVSGLFTLPPLDRDESRFAQASRQMVETGDWVDIRFQETARHKKPVGIYWLQATAVSLIGEPGANPIWVYRLPSLLGAGVAVLLCFAIGRVLFGAETALAAALLLASALVLGVEARLAKTDAVQLACLLVTQLALARIYTASRKREAAPRMAPWLFWLGIGIGSLVKGPIVPMVAGLTIASLAVVDRKAADRVRWWQALRPFPTALLALAIVLPWLVAISLATHGGFMRESVGGDLVPKLLAGEESHGAPPGYYLALFTLTFWPSSLVALLAIPWVWQQRRQAAIRFCLAWLIPAWLVFEAIPTKLPHYSLPTYPAIALLAAAALMAGGVRLAGLWARLALGWWLLVTLALAAGLGSFGFVIDGRPLWGGILAGVAAVLLGGAATWAILRDHRQLLVVVLAALVIPVYGLTFQMALPASEGFWLSRAAGQAVAAAGEGDHPLVAAAGYTEPSLVFALGTATRFVRGAGAADLLAQNEAALALVETAHRGEFERQAAARGLVLAPPVMIEGFNYSRGKRTVLALYRKAAP